MSKRKPINPFYILLLLAGVAFSVTAFAFGVMTVRGLRQSRVAAWELPAESHDVSAMNNNERSQSFDDFLDRHGTTALIVELVLLGIGTVGAIAYDQHLDRREASNTLSSPLSNSEPQDENQSPQ